MSSKNKEKSAKQSPADPNVIDAEPIKEFFILMLVKDIPLVRAIIDLVDNCVDGARSLRKKGSYKGLQVKLKVDSKLFEITDNCGGIDVETARSYAFRFGRPADAPATTHSVGQFGVGMKRALFKLGTIFKVESTARTSQFLVDINVDTWKKEEEWEFKFKKRTEKTKFPEADWGTTISVTKLHEAVAAEFELENFRKSLYREIAAAHRDSIGKELEIQLNGTIVAHVPTELKRAKGLQPGHREMRITQQGKKPIKIRMYVGVSESAFLGEGSREAISRDAGWYIFCNERMVLGADKTLATGWGVTKETKIPQFHPQFAEFRGFVYFDCDDATRLPWNTTKTGVDTDSLVFQKVRQDMITLMRPVINMFNLIRNEQRRDGPDGPLQTFLREANLVSVSDIKRLGAFIYPQLEVNGTPPTENVKIRYERPTKQVEFLKKRLRVTTPKKVGESTFDYVYGLDKED